VLVVGASLEMRVVAVGHILRGRSVSTRVHDGRRVRRSRRHCRPLVFSMEIEVARAN
jgi:hypothetical protein